MSDKDSSTKGGRGGRGGGHEGRKRGRGEGYGGLEAVFSEVAAAKDEVSAAKDKVAAAEIKVAAAKDKVAAAEIKVHIIEKQDLDEIEEQKQKIERMEVKIDGQNQEIAEQKQKIKRMEEEIMNKTMKGQDVSDDKQRLQRLEDGLNIMMQRLQRLEDGLNIMMQLQLENKKQLTIEKKVPKRMNFDLIDVSNIDHCTRQYFESIPTLLPESSDRLKLFLEQCQPSKFDISRTFFQTFIESSCWESAVLKCTNVVNDDQASCLALEKMLIRIISGFKNLWAMNSEYAMISVIDDIILPVALLYGCSVYRKSSSSGSYRPDFFLAPNGPPLYVGEDKLRSHYKKGMKHHDPVLENEYKTAWDLWSHFWGDVPYIFAYAAVGDQSNFDFTLGVLEREKKKFVPLEQYDIKNGNDTKLWLTYIKLLPIFKSIQNVSRSTAKNRVPYQETRTTNLLHGRNVTITKTICTIDGTAVFHKCWMFTHDAEATAFLNLQQKIFNALKKLKNPSFVYESKGTSFHCSGGDKSVIKAYFSPFGQKCIFEIETLDELTQAVLSISKAVLLMHSAGIVHNDIRWDNVIVHNNDYILIDFDDAYILSNAEEFCPALSHLRPNEHAERTFIPHRFEVDIWAIGRLIVTALSNYNFGFLEQQQQLRDLGLRVMNSYTDFKLTSVITELERFLH